MPQLNGTILDSINLDVCVFKGVHSLAGQFEILLIWTMNLLA